MFTVGLSGRCFAFCFLNSYVNDQCCKSEQNPSAIAPHCNKPFKPTLPYHHQQSLMPQSTHVLIISCHFDSKASKQQQALMNVNPLTLRYLLIIITYQ